MVSNITLVESMNVVTTVSLVYLMLLWKTMQPSLILYDKERFRDQTSSDLPAATPLQNHYRKKLVAYKHQGRAKVHRFNLKVDHMLHFKEAQNKHSGPPATLSSYGPISPRIPSSSVSTD